MKKQDLFFIIFILILFVPFAISEDLYEFYSGFNKSHGIITAFIKFAILATLGECLGLRIKEGVYNKKGFGLLPRAFVWGFLGITIKVAFVIFAGGTPELIKYLGIEKVDLFFKSDFSWEKLLVAFSISFTMNLVYAPVMMTFHKITDTHIIKTGGNFKNFFSKIDFAEIFKNIDWNVQWNFVFKKTIPFFWIPAHTITFMLPPETRVLFAAILGIALGTILAFANLKSEKIKPLPKPKGASL